MVDYRITTLDNPYSPFDDFDNWYQYDEEHGYCTSGYLARLIKIDEFDAPDAIFNDEYDRAVDEIADLNILGIYKKVSAADYANDKWKPININDILEKFSESAS